MDKAGQLIAPHSEARTELAHHVVDLRVHASVMLFNAILMGYCSYRVLDIDASTVSDESLSAAASADGLSICCAAALFVIEILCILEALRCWKRSVSTEAGMQTAMVSARGRFARLRMIESAASE